MDNITNFPPVGKPDKVKITDQYELMELLVKRVKSAAPQTRVRKGHLILFDNVVEQFREGGNYEDVGPDWEECFVENFNTLAESEGWEMCNGAVAWIPASIMARCMHRNANIEMDYFFELLFQALGAEKLVKSNVKRKSVYLTASKGFCDKFGVSFKVKIKRSDESLHDTFHDLLSVICAKSTFKPKALLAEILRRNRRPAT